MRVALTSSTSCGQKGEKGLIRAVGSIWWLFLSPLAEELEEQLEKMLMARGTARDEAQKLHRKWLKHQAFMVELACNKEWLAKIELVSRGEEGEWDGRSDVQSI